MDSKAKKKEKTQYEQALDLLRKAAFDKLIKGEKIAISEVFKDVLNALLLSERDIYLLNNDDNSANGFYDRDLTLSFGKLNIKVPRVRIGNTFKPALLPERWKRVDKDYENFLLALLVNGYSKAKIKETLKSMNMPYSEESMQNLIEMIYEHLQYYKSDTIDSEMFAVFMDAYRAKLRDDSGKMKEISLYVSVGIDLDGNKKILGWWVKKGKENIGFWTEVLQDMISRGLSKVMIFVTDDFPGLDKVIKKLFPMSDHQLCVVHLKRNLRKKLSKEGYKRVSKLLREIKDSVNYEEAKMLWTEVVKIVNEESTNLGKRLENKGERYIAFTKYPEEIRKYIYTTNVVESINSGIELMRQELMTYYKYPYEMRSLIYTTNAIESLNSMFRKVTRGKK
ncbi:MAG: IS256 family transposase, partial [Thermotogaceae bacterium]|nr:IS256 family transposase [Thermotogaceae bacterium]